jgi:hypothetical protein
MIQVAKFSLQEKVRLKFQPITLKEGANFRPHTCVMSDDEKMRVFLSIYTVSMTFN